MTPAPNPTEIRTTLEKAAKLMGYDGGYLFRAGGKAGSGLPYNIEGFQRIGGSLWSPHKDAHDSRILAIHADIDVTHYHRSGYVVAYVDKADQMVYYPPHPTTADKLQCELLAVLKCAAAIWDEREKL